MSDLRRALLSFAEPPLLPPDAIDDLQQRERRRRCMSRMRVSFATAACVSVIAAGFVLVGREPGRTIGVAATEPPSSASTVVPGSPTTTATPGASTPLSDPQTSPTTGARATTATTVAGPPAEPVVTTPSELTPSTTAAVACRNSYNAACGPFRWDPEPLPRPLAVRVTTLPLGPQPGQEVTFAVEVNSDAGSAVLVLADSGDGGAPAIVDGARSCARPGQPARYGPWDLPTPAAVQFTMRFAWTYASAGTFIARFAFQGSSCNPQYDPVYQSFGEHSVTVVVAR